MGNTTVFSPPIGDVVLPLDSAGNLAGNNVSVAGTLSGAGVTAAVKAIVGAQVLSAKANFLAPLPADLVSIVAAVTPSNVALTLASQPPQARKLQYRIVIGTSPTTAITAGNLAVIGFDQDGNAQTESISLITTTSKTVLSAKAWGSITSATVSAYAASGSGTGNTIGIGVSNDFGVPTGQGAVSNFALVKATKVITTVTGGVTAWSRAVTDDVASTATVDAVARTVNPTTAPGVAGINDYEFTVSYTLAA